MFHHTESKFQGWRAVAVLESGCEYLLYLGRSSSQIRAGYEEAFFKNLSAQEQKSVTRVSLQCWQGAADQGTWTAKGSLAVPEPGSVSTSIVSNNLPAAVLSRALFVRTEDY